MNGFCRYECEALCEMQQFEAKSCYVAHVTVENVKFYGHATGS